MMDVKLGRGNLFEKGPPSPSKPPPPTSKNSVFIESLFVNVRSALYGAFCFSLPHTVIVVRLIRFTCVRALRSP